MSFCADLSVVYTFGPQFGRRVVTHADLDQMQLPPPVLRRSAFEHLEVLSSRAEFHGQPPALMLSFEGLESSLVLASDFWTRLEGAVPGELVVGVPARDVVIVTGSQSGAGMEKVRRCVERVFFAGGDHPLSRNLLVRRGGAWEPFDRPARQAGGRPGFGPAHQLGLGQPPRQYQEHPSWPSEQVPSRQRPESRPAGPGRRCIRPPRHPMRPAAAAGRPAVPPGMRPVAMGGPMTSHGGPMTNHGGPLTNHRLRRRPVPRGRVLGPPPAAAHRPTSPSTPRCRTRPCRTRPCRTQRCRTRSRRTRRPRPPRSCRRRQLRSAPSYSPGPRPAAHEAAPYDKPRTTSRLDEPVRQRPLRRQPVRRAGLRPARSTTSRSRPTATTATRPAPSRATRTRPARSRATATDRVRSRGSARAAVPAAATPTTARPSPGREYPASWGWAPEQSASRPEWKASPRARVLLPLSAGRASAGRSPRPASGVTRSHSSSVGEQLRPRLRRRQGQVVLAALDAYQRDVLAQTRRVPGDVLDVEHGVGVVGRLGELAPVAAGRRRRPGPARRWSARPAACRWAWLIARTQPA